MDNNLLDQFNVIIGRSDKDKAKYLNFYNTKKKEIQKNYYKNNKNIKEKENSKKIIVFLILNKLKFNKDFIKSVLY